MVNERPEGEAICPVDQTPCEGQGTDAECNSCPEVGHLTKEDVIKLSKVRASLTHWNYRVVRTVDPDGDVEYGVYECYWAEDKMISRTEEPVTSTYDTLKDLRRAAEAILAALDQEVLEDEP